jgi:hypothetical protein
MDQRREPGPNCQVRIARSLGITPAMACLDIQRALRDWREAHRGRVNEHVEFELARLNQIDLEAEAEWQWNKDPRFHELMLRCNCERRKLLGLDRRPCLQLYGHRFKG